MKLSLNDKGIMEVEEIFNPIILRTKYGETITICMRDEGFEFEYEGKRYSAKKGVLEPFQISYN